MNTKDLARFFVRFQAAVFVFYGVVAASYFGTYFRAFDTLHATKDLNDAATIIFLGELFRVGIHFVLALILFLNTDRVISYFVANPSPPSKSESS
jgi:hypothetical protein